MMIRHSYCLMIKYYESLQEETGRKIFKSEEINTLKFGEKFKELGLDERYI